MSVHHLKRGIAYTAALIAGCAGIWMCGLLVKQEARIWRGSENGFLNRLCSAWMPENAACTSSAHHGAALDIPIPRFNSTRGFEMRPMRVPLAFVGLGYFVGLTAWLLVVGPPRGTDSWWRHAPRACASAGCIASALLLGRMLTGSAPPCAGCALVHLLNFLLTASIWLVGARQSVEPLPESGALALRRTRTRLAGVAVAIAVIAVAGLWYHRHEQLALARHVQNLTPYRDLVALLRSDADHLLRDHYAETPVDIPLRPSAGDGHTPASIVVFTDYACAACKCNDSRLYALLAAAFADKVRIDVRHLPRCRACAAGKTPGPHAEGCAAAYAAEAVRELGGEAMFRMAHARLLTERGPWTQPRLAALAEELGLDVPSFETALTGDSVRATVDADVAAARTLGVDAVPAVFLNGRRVGPLSVDNPAFWQSVAAGIDATAPGQFAGLCVDNL